jgi:hypothetical protein
MNSGHIDDFVTSWFSLLSAHAPVDDLIPFLCATNLQMHFPEETLRSLDDFRTWYTAVGNTYTDQHHDLQQLNVRTDKHNGDLLDLGIVVVWTASTIADGSHIAKRATQTWTIRRSANSDRSQIQLQIQKYDVVTMTDVGQDR